MSTTTPVVVTTQHRGVFFGYLPNDTDKTTKTIQLTDARMCIRWTEDIKGVVGLAATGPSRTCRIGPAAPELLLHDVTAVMTTTPEAEQAWLAAPWS